MFFWDIAKHRRRASTRRPSGVCGSSRSGEPKFRCVPGFQLAHTVYNSSGMCSSGTSRSPVGGHTQTVQHDVPPAAWKRSTHRSTNDFQQATYY